MNKEELYIENRKRVIRRRMEIFNKRHPLAPLTLPENTSGFFECLTNSAVCSGCTERCCVCFPCKYSPYDFLDLNDLEYMSSILDLGLLCISETNYTKLLIIRPRGLYDSPRIVSMYKDYSHNMINPCILQNTKGCMLSAYHRPSEGLLYIPITQNEHVDAYTERTLEEEYMPYQYSLKKLYDKYYHIEIPKEKPNKRQVRQLTRKIMGY